ncbi:hypothetical protein L7F22_060625 [Adiantum nelumboides]|nr:hypothetical protein [Adiantum nelumboides]
MVSENGTAASDRSTQGLRLYNTLSASKEPFYTQDRSRRVTWYICGPTVYDSSHLGHARNYLSFDILRRVLEGYFHYNVLYVMNVTDVDDKIINTARRSHLLSQFLETTKDPSQVLSELMKAFEVERRKQDKKVQEAKKELFTAASARQRQDLENNLKQEELKFEKLSQAFASVKQKEASVGTVGSKEGIEMLLEGDAAAVLASYLDDIGKAKVSDLAIFRAHAAKYEEDFFDDMQALGVKPPNVLTRVTEYIDVIILYIQKIMERGLAYAVNNSVYFDTKAFMDAGHTYGKLNPCAVGSLGLSSESESDFQTRDKKNSIDFALWKASKPGESFWESPWGHGRPGWHIECSAMASDIIGSVMDIHSGGQDLMFPHHDNEFAQAEAYHGCSQWVNFFLHSGHLSIEGLKMSKSLKNFITIKEALKAYTPRQLRFLFVYEAWNKPINFSEAVMKEALTKERDLQSFFKIVKNYLRKAGMDGDTYSKGLKGPQFLTADDKTLLHALRVAESEVQERLEDNIDTRGALLALLNLASAVNSYVDKTVKFDRQKAPGLLQPLPTPDKPWESIAMDFIFDLPRTPTGNDGIWTIICRFSKPAHFVPVRKKIKLDHMVKLFMHNIIKYHGLPQSLVSDRDPRMTSLFCGTTLKFSSLFHPQIGRQSEEANSTLLDLLKCCVLEHKDTWEQYLPLVEYAYNNTKHTSTGKEPFEIVEGGKKVPPILQTKDKIFVVDKYVQNTDEAYRKIKLALEKTQSKQKKAADRHPRELVFSLGDWVLLRFEKARLKLPEGWKIHNAFHVSLLRPFVGDVPKDMVLEEQCEVEELVEILVPEQILTHKDRKVRGKVARRYLVKFKYYSPMDAKWMEEAELLVNFIEFFQQLAKHPKIQELLQAPTQTPKASSQGLQSPRQIVSNQLQRRETSHEQKSYDAKGKADVIEQPPASIGHRQPATRELVNGQDST